VLLAEKSAREDFMRLQDSVVAAKTPLCVALDGHGLFTLPNALSIAGDVEAAPLRYVLDDAVAAIAARAAFADPHRMIDCLELLRLPAPLLWLEWSERGRRLVMSELGLVDPIEAARAAGRAGLLVKSDETGRRGEVVIAWDGDAAEPDLSPLVMRFDLDDSDFATRASANVETRSLRIGDSATLSTLLGHVRFELMPAWSRYYDAACSTPAARDAALQESLAVIAGDFPFLAAFCILIAAKNAVAFQPIELGRLNASRAKRGKPPLLDHIEVKARLGGARALGRPGQISARTESRLHFVSGHFVRRGSAIYWRRAHLRGNVARGVVSARTIVVLPNMAIH
jgi:hypothetical protein